jgi:hypothetical protein
MDRILRYELSDEVCQAIEEMAASTGISTEALALQYLARRSKLLRPAQSEAERDAARERFRRSLGAASLGHATGVDNAEIDADLAREYGTSHDNGR